MSAVLIRHAAAGDRRRFQGDDRLRPLTGKGRRQAAALAAALVDAGIARVVSSPYLRCVQTVEPLAAALGVPVERSDGLAEGAGRQQVMGLLADAGPGAAFCTHGDVCELLVGHVRKGEARIVEVGAGGGVRQVRAVEPAG